MTRPGPGTVLAEHLAELEAWERRLKELGADHSPIKEGATGWLITFRDPNNIQFEMYTQGK